MRVVIRPWPVSRSRWAIGGLAQGSVEAGLVLFDGQDKFRAPGVQILGVDAVGGEGISGDDYLA